MKIRNQDFNFDILNAADADRIQQAVDTLQAAAAAIPKNSSFGDIIRANCALLDDFLAQVLGEDYDARLNVSSDDLRGLKALYFEVLEEIVRAKEELAAPSFSAPAAVARTDLKVQARQAAQAASAALPAVNEAAAPAPKAAAPDFSRMNRAQRRAWVKALKGGR